MKETSTQGKKEYFVAPTNEKKGNMAPLALIIKSM